MKLKTVWKNNRSLIVFVLLMSVFRSAVADWYSVPTGSMKPTIVEGDRIGVNKMAYDLRIPFTHVSMYSLSEPERGDIVVFDSKAADNRMVKRVIGLPGEWVSMQNGVIFVNGEQAQYTQTSIDEQMVQANEKLGNMSHQLQILRDFGSELDSFAAVEVPKDHYLVLGDNRRNSADSRVYGFVPRNEIVGRAGSVVMSFNYDNYYIPRKERFFKSLI